MHPHGFKLRFSSNVRVVARRGKAPISVGGRHGVATHGLFAKQKSGGSEPKGTRKPRHATRADARERRSSQSSDRQEHPAGTRADAREAHGTIQPCGQKNPPSSRVVISSCAYLSNPRERRARAPLPAGAGVARGVEVEWMERHENRTAGRGCTMRLDRPLLRDGFSAASIKRMGGIRCHGKSPRGEIQQVGDPRESHQLVSPQDLNSIEGLDAPL